MIIENKNNKTFIVLNRADVKDGPSTPEERRVFLRRVCEAIREGGYNPVSQLVGYILSDDPTHIANYNNARSLMGQIDRDELIEDMVSAYIKLIEDEKDSEER